VEVDPYPLPQFPLQPRNRCAGGSTSNRGIRPARRLPTCSVYSCAGTTVCRQSPQGFMIAVGHGASCALVV